MKLFSYTTMLAFFIAQFVNSQDIKLNGTISAENNQIKNVADPTVAQDVATKNYVDSNVNSFSGSYNDLTDTPTMYTQAQVDELINNLRDELGNQIDNDGRRLMLKSRLTLVKHQKNWMSLPRDSNECIRSMSSYGGSKCQI